MPIFTVPLHEFNPCHTPAGQPTGGQFCSGPSAGWAPSMSPEAAAAWAKDSLVKGPLYFVGARGSVEQIEREGFSLRAGSWKRTWGEGVYLGTSTASRDFYLKAKKELGKNAVAVQVVANVKAPLVLVMDRRERMPRSFGELVRILPKELQREFAARQQADPTFGEAAFTQTLQAAGYDSILITSSKTRTFKDFNWNVAGGPQLVVFNPQQVTVIGRDQGRAKAPRATKTPALEPAGAPITLAFKSVTPSVQPVARAAKGNLALHPSIRLVFDKDFNVVPGKFELDKEEFTITHVPTGMAVVHGLTRDSGQQILSLLQRNAPAKHWATTDASAITSNPKLKSAVRGALQLRKRLNNAAFQKMMAGMGL